MEIERDLRYQLQNFYEPVEMPGGWKFDHVSTLKFNHLYYYGKFESGNTDEHGMYKFFTNVTKPACDIATKFVDIDVANILFIPDGGSDMNANYTWLMARDFKLFTKESGFAHSLNVVSQEYPKGHVVLKWLGDRYVKVPIVSLRVDPSIGKLDKMQFIMELHKVSLSEAKEMGLDYEQMQARYGQTAERGLYDVYEVYTRDLNGWTRCFYTGLYDTAGGGGIHRSAESKINTQDTFMPALKVGEEKHMKSHPYRELKYEDVEGRWLGFGVPEYLKDNQISENEAENLERKALILKALQLYQSPDESVAGKNVLTSATNGDILITDGITPVQKDNADLSAYNNTRGRNMENIQRKTFTTDITTGANLPSRTPLGVANIQASFATSFFDHKQEDEGLFIKDLLYRDVLPSFKNTKRKSHQITFMLSDDDRKKMEKIIIDMKMFGKRYEYLQKTGFSMSLGQIQDAYQRASDDIRGREALSVKVPDAVYDTVKYHTDIVITGESQDVGSKNAMLQVALQTVGSNPAILENDITRQVFFKFLSLGGVSPTEFDMIRASEEMQRQTPVPQGGSIAAPQQVSARGTQSSMV